MSEHTPGPWHYYEHVTYRTVEPGVEEPEDSWIEIRDEGDIMVATLPGGSIYDGALIAAAPDMAAELERVRAKCERLQDELNKTEEALAVSRMEQSELNYAHDEITKLTIDNAQLLEACKVAFDAINLNDETLTARDALVTAIEAAEGES